MENSPRVSAIHFALMMVRKGDADGAVLGLKAPYSEVIRPSLQMIGLDPSVQRLLGMSMLPDRRGRPLFFSDCLVNQNPSAQELASIAGWRVSISSPGCSCPTCWRRH